MSVAIEKLEREFKKLTATEQAKVLWRFAKIVSNSEEARVVIETLKRRVAKIEAGAVRGRDAFEVIDKIKRKHSR